MDSQLANSLVPANSSPRAKSPYLSARAAAVHEFDYAYLLLGIATAGGVYPIVFTLIMIAWYVPQLLIRQGFQSDPLLQLLAGLILLFPWSLFLFIAGCIYAGIVAVFLLPTVVLFLKTLRVRCNSAILGGFTGGLVGFSCTWHMWYSSSTYFSLLWLDLLLGPVLATIIGQIGGARNGRLAQTQARAVARLALELLEENESPERPAPRVQFGLRQMFLLTLWISILLGFFKATGILSPQFLLIVLGWLAVQAITLTVLLRWVLPTWNRSRPSPARRTDRI